MMTFLNPLDALIPKIPFSFFPDFWVWVTSEARGSDSVGFGGSCQLSPFWGRGGVRPEGSIDPPPPETKTRPPLSYASNQHQTSGILGLDKGGFLFLFLFGTTTVTSLSSSGLWSPFGDTQGCLT